MPTSYGLSHSSFLVKMAQRDDLERGHAEAAVLTRDSVHARRGPTTLVGLRRARLADIGRYECLDRFRLDVEFPQTR
jgi:hypothetical protein